MEYKVGDKVKVREDLVVGKEYGEYCFDEDMVQYKGATVTIERVITEEWAYFIKEDERLFWWTDEMFEPLENENSPDETNVSEDWGLCKDGSESPSEAVEALESVDCLLEVKFREAVDKITPEELKEIFLKKVNEAVKNMSDDMFQDILADVLS